MAAKASAVSALAPDWTITNPRPDDAPTNSAMTAPITARVIAFFNPTNICGRAHRNRILTNPAVPSR